MGYENMVEYGEFLFSRATYLLVCLVEVEDIEVAETEALRVPELRVCDFLVAHADVLEFGLQLHGNLALDMVCALQSVRPFHLSDR